MIAVTGIPVLETERLILRAPEPRDAEAAIAFMTSERSQHVGGPLPRDKAWRLFAVEVAHWVLRGYGMWAVTLKGDDRCVGFVGCWCPEGWPERELGWSVLVEAEGKGIAYEAALEARRYAYDTLGWTTAVSYIDKPNQRSIRLAQRLGAVLDETAAYPGQDAAAEPCFVYRHPSPAELVP
ncbi:MAG: GNAT family N-acetyltransferase [Pseudomonadota bacterium]